MGMEMLKSMKDTLMCCAQGQMGHLESVDAKELGEVVDMIKDLEEAMYYCTITESMKKAEEEGNGSRYNTTVYYSEPRDYRDMDKMYGRMYYPMYNDGRMYQPMYNDGTMYANGDSSGGSGGSSGGRGGSSGSSNSGSSGSGGGHSNYHERQIPYDMMMRDYREGQSPMSRRRYMEAKEMKHDKNIQLQELEKYIKELSSDVVEMIEDASPEEKKYLANRMSSLAQKVAKLESDD